MLGDVPLFIGPENVCASILLTRARGGTGREARAHRGCAAAADGGRQAGHARERRQCGDRARAAHAAHARHTMPLRAA